MLLSDVLQISTLQWVKYFCCALGGLLVCSVNKILLLLMGRYLATGSIHFVETTYATDDQLGTLLLFGITDFLFPQKVFLFFRGNPVYLL